MKKLGYTTALLKANNSQNIRITKSEPTLKKSKTIPSARKVTAIVFWQDRGVIFIDYIVNGKTINDKYYGNILLLENDEIKETGTLSEKESAVLA